MDNNNTNQGPDVDEEGRSIGATSCVSILYRSPLPTHSQIQLFLPQLPELTSLPSLYFPGGLVP